MCLFNFSFNGYFSSVECFFDDDDFLADIVFNYSSTFYLVSWSSSFLLTSLFFGALTYGEKFGDEISKFQPLILRLFYFMV